VRIDPKAEAARRTFEHRVVSRSTRFRLIDGDQAASLQDVYALLTRDEDRNRMICEDVLEAIRHSRSPLLLTERRDHLDLLADRLRALVPATLLLHGGLGARQRQQVAAQLRSIPPDQPRLLLATGRYIGEGFDDARLDTLFLALPISWRGTVQQYAGRLHRAHDAKKTVMIFDYIDSKVPVLARMFQRRVKGYQAIGYEVAKDVGDRMWTESPGDGSQFEPGRNT
jgi:superfamily II DNA or RNA helicase